MSRTMKDSGIPWIGEIPEGWDVVRLKDIANIQRGGSPRPIEEYLSNTGYNWIKIGDTIKGDKYIHSVSQKIKESGLSKTRMVYRGDLILTNSMSFGEPYILNVDGCIHDGWVAFSNIKATDKEFLFYLLSSPLCKMQFNLQVAGGVVQNLNVDKISSTTILLPPLAEQHLIATFLDKKCSEIDSLIDLQEQMIEELKAYKQSVITEAVTKGLNPNVPMKDSGIEWIGDVPEEWEVKYFWKVNYIRGRLGWKGLKADEYQEVGYPFLSAFNIINDRLDWKNVNYITQERYDESPEIKLNIGDILIVKDGAGIGKCARIDNLPQGEATVNSSLAVITPKSDVYYGFEYYFLLSTPFQYVIWFLKIGMGVPHLTQENMRDIIMVCPSIKEQQAIADYLDKKCGEIDELIIIKQQKIESLKEYKKSVIYEYVTGKREV